MVRGSARGSSGVQRAGARGARARAEGVNAISALLRDADEWLTRFAAAPRNLRIAVRAAAGQASLAPLERSVLTARSIRCADGSRHDVHARRVNAARRRRVPP